MKQPHLYVNFATIRYDTTTALKTLAAIFTKKPINHPVQATTMAPKDAKINIQKLWSNQYSRPQSNNNPSSPSNVVESKNSPHPLRVVTLSVRGAATPRVPERVLNLSPRNLFHGYFLGIGIANQAIDLGEKHGTNMPIMNAVLNPVTRENTIQGHNEAPSPCTSVKKFLGNELRQLLQGICDIKGNNNFFFVDLVDILRFRKTTYGKLVCDLKQHKAEKELVSLTVGGEIMYYSIEVAIYTADITTFKILTNPNL